MNSPRRLASLASCVLSTVVAVAQDAPGAGQAPSSTTPVLDAPGVRKLTIGGQYRLRYENRIRYDFDRHGAADNDFFTQRARINLGFELTDDLSVFTQIQDVREWGEETSTLDDSADGLDLHQAYLHIAHTPGIGGSLRLGRQELSYGDQRLVGALDWKTQARAFDGARGVWSLGEGQPIDVFVTQLRENLDGVADDFFFTGAHATLRPADPVVGDLYLLYLHDDGSTLGGAASRGTVGTRWVWTAKPVEFGAELATQFGDEAGVDVAMWDTYAVHVHGMWRAESESKPFVKLGLDMASGDDPATPDQERFNNLFPTAHAHWGIMDLAQWENLFNPHVQVGCTPCDHWDTTLAWHYFRSMEGTDRFGGPNGNISPGGAGFSRTMGQEIDLVVTRHLELPKGLKGAVQAGYGIFLPGQGVEDALGTDDIAHFVYAQLQVSF